MKPPIPATKTAWLPSQGYDYMRATKHKFVKAVETSVPGADPGTWEDVWQLIFACQETGAERVWGIVSRDLFRPDVPYERDN